MQKSVQLSDTVKAGRILQLWGCISLLLMTVIAAFTVISLYIDGEMVPLFGILGFVFLLTIPCMYLLIGHYVKRQRKWAKISGLIVSIIFLVNIPIGTVIGAITIYYLMSGWDENNSAV